MAGDIQTAERISREEYFNRLEVSLLFPLSEEERLLAVRLAKKYTGRIVIEEWTSWVRSGGGGFLLFARALPEELRKAEEIRLALDKEKSGETKQQKEQQKEMFENLPDPFASVWKGLKLKKDGILPFPGLLKPKNTGKEQDKLGQLKAGYLDPEQGWCIGGLPVF